MKNVVLCAVIGTVVGSVLASTTREWSLTGVGAGIGAGIGFCFDRAGITNNIGVGLVIAGAAIRAAVGSVAASTTKEWSLTGVGAGVGVGVGGAIALYLARASKKDE